MLLNNRYKIIRSLGSGGFGETFLAEDTQMPSQRRCVIKQLRPIQDNPQVYELVKQRFQREAAILEELGDGSDRIPRLYAYFTENGQFYLVQEYVQGETLSAKLQTQGVMSESAVKELLINILPVLDYVHSKGIVHRDIKPDNILLRYQDSKPVLIDFGAVKETVGTVLTPSGNSDKSIIIGTPGFMPSEQSMGRPMFASDIYSLGLTAIYLLTGKIPQDLPTDPATGAILWRQYVPSITPNFASVLDQTIQYNAQNRFNSAREMLQAMQTDSATAIPTVQQSSHPHTIPVSPGYSQPSTVQNSSSNSNGNKGIIFGSIIGAGLIGASIVIGFAISKSPVISPSEPKPTTASIQPNTTPTNSQNSSSSLSDDSTLTNSTPEVVSPPTSPSPTVVSPPTSPSPEVVSSPTSPSPEVVSSPTPPTSAVERTSPTQAIEDYYLNINRQEYEVAWNKLSPNLQNNKRLHPNGYLSFIDWWGGKVQSVDINQVNLVQENRNTAIIDAQLQYKLKTGKVAPGSVRFSLVWDVSSNQWVVVDVK